jgi:hypothetical protein
MTFKKAIKQIRNKIATQFPFLRDGYRVIRWRILQAMRRIYIRNKSKILGLHEDPYKIYWIDTESIQYGIYEQIPGVPKTEMAAGIIKGGDWDRKAVPIDEISIIKSAKQKFISGLKWEETDYYREILDCISRGQTKRRCKTKEDVRSVPENLNTPLGGKSATSSARLRAQIRSREWQKEQGGDTQRHSRQRWHWQR